MEFHVRARTLPASPFLCRFFSPSIMEVPPTGDPHSIAPGDEDSTTGKSSAPHHTPNSTTTTTNPEIPTGNGQELASPYPSGSTPHQPKSTPPAPSTPSPNPTWASRAARAPQGTPTNPIATPGRQQRKKLGCLLRITPTVVSGEDLSDGRAQTVLAGLALGF